MPKDNELLEFGEGFARGMLGGVHKSPENFDAKEQGELCGEFALNLVALQALHCGVRALGKSFEEAITLRSANFFEVPLSATPEFSVAVKSCVDSLPTRYRKFLDFAQLKVIPLRDIAEVEPSLPWATGLFTIRGGKPYIFVSESAHRLNNGFLTNHLNQTLHHEVTHAIDYTYRRGKLWLSDDPYLTRVFEEEWKALPHQDKTTLLTQLGRGKMDIVKKEIVAELVSRHNVPNIDSMDGYFISRFPRMNTMLNAGTSPFSPIFRPVSR